MLVLSLKKKIQKTLRQTLLLSDFKMGSEPGKLCQGKSEGFCALNLIQLWRGENITALAVAQAGILVAVFTLGTHTHAFPDLLALSPSYLVY